MQYSVAPGHLPRYRCSLVINKIMKAISGLGKDATHQNVVLCVDSLFSLPFKENTIYGVEVLFCSFMQIKFLSSLYIFRFFIFYKSPEIRSMYPYIFDHMLHQACML